LLTSDWDTSESRPRKYYTVSSQGREVLGQLMLEWGTFRGSLEAICGKECDSGK
jgi:DNA-binding PadR family transcriptional regulator